jgi:hypothetical protein
MEKSAGATYPETAQGRSQGNSPLPVKTPHDPLKKNRPSPAARPLRLNPILGNDKGVALPFLGGTCGLLGDSCGRPELPRHDADEALEQTGELALVPEVGEYNPTQPVPCRFFRLTSTACPIALWVSPSVGSAGLGSAPRLYLVAYGQAFPCALRSERPTHRLASLRASVVYDRRAQRR